ncbi:hypothetical protein RND71_008428 [Anisodus tanguticus]|uniref:Xaa-Pro dipeptidyl-peptidase-like domain-containing protein n=1 Tax=Anisodus tanguticus TaxID=243964 RepID=A0AAE1VTS6_9SOLA|nr:hypothetical protein RND71_008428 [Anisodus tanguticus]
MTMSLVCPLAVVLPVFYTSLVNWLKVDERSDINDSWRITIIVAYRLEIWDGEYWFQLVKKHLYDESTDSVTLDGRVFRPNSEKGDGVNVVAVLVHPYSVLGGCQGLMRGIARGLSSRGVIAVTCDTRGAGKSTGRASLTGSPEINDVSPSANGFSPISPQTQLSLLVHLQVN